MQPSMPQSSVPDFYREGAGKTPPTHQVEKAYLFGTDNPDPWVDVSPFADKKRQAIRCHRGQVARGEGVETNS